MRFLIGFILLVTMTASAAVNDADKALVGSHIELLLNPGFENGRASWTASGGTLATATSGTSLLAGRSSVTWNSNGAAQTFCSSLVTVPQGAMGRPGIGSIVMEVPSGTSTHVLQVRDGSSNVLATSGSRSYAGGATDSQRVQTSVFSFPSSGTVQLCVVSVAADEPLVALDSATLRTDPWNLVALQSSSLVASGVFPTTANCAWDTTATGALTDFNADTDCPAPTLISNEGPGTLLTTDTDLPQFTINNLPPGSCQVSFAGTITHTVASTNASIGISDGTTTYNAFTTVTQPTIGNGTAFQAISTFRYTEAGNRTFRIRGRTVSGTQTVNIGTGFTSASPTLSFQISCSPLQANQALRVDQIGWKVDANIAGGQPDLGTSNQASYIGLENSTLTLTQNAGSAPVQIGCSGTTAPTGVTCGSNESVAIAFSPPVSGDYIACASFGHFIGISTSGNVQATFQIVETATNAQTVIQEGKSRVPSGVGFGVIGSNTYPMRVCGNFTFTNVSQKMLRLMYEQTVSATVTSNLILADAPASNGQRDIHWEVYPVNPWIQAPTLIGSVVSNSTGVERIERATVTCGTSSSITSQSGSWLSSISSGTTGVCTLNIAASIFSATPTCLSTATASTGRTDLNGTLTSSSVGLRLADSSNTPFNGAINVVCMGPR